MSNWVKTSKSKKIKSIYNNKIVLISPIDTRSVVPLFCPCCKFPMKDSDDSISYRKNKICNHCNEKWSKHPEVTWPKGPDKDSTEWKVYIKYRTVISRPVITFK